MDEKTQSGAIMCRKLPLSNKWLFIKFLSLPAVLNHILYQQLYINIYNLLKNICMYLTYFGFLKIISSHLDIRLTNNGGSSDGRVTR